MRTSPSGPQIPDEFLRHSFPLATALAGMTVLPLWGAPGSPPIDQSSPAAIATAFPVPPGRLGSMSITIVSLGGNTGSPIQLVWLVQNINGTTTTVPIAAIDPTQPPGPIQTTLDYSGVIIPEGGAGIAPAFVIPGDLVVGTQLYVIALTEVFWK